MLCTQCVRCKSIKYEEMKRDKEARGGNIGKIKIMMQTSKYIVVVNSAQIKDILD